MPKLWGPLIHSFHPAIFWASEETKQILTRYKAEARTKAGVGLEGREELLCEKGILGVGTGGQSLCKVAPERRG